MSYRIHNPGTVEGNKLSKSAADYIASLEQRIASLEGVPVVTATPPTTITPANTSVQVFGDPHTGYTISVDRFNPIQCQVFGP